jgi:hypothetical protein
MLPELTRYRMQSRGRAFPPHGDLASGHTVLSSATYYLHLPRQALVSYQYPFLYLCGIVYKYAQARWIQDWWLTSLR